MNIKHLQTVAAGCLVLCFASLSLAKELHLQFEVTRESIPASGTIKTIDPGETEASATSNGPTTQPARKRTKTGKVTVILGDDYFVMDDEGQRAIYNFKTKRLVLLDTAKSTVRDDSLFLIVGFNDMEFQNRIMLHSILSQVTEDEGEESFSSDDAFNLEAAFKVNLSSLDSPRVLEAAKKLAPTQIKSTTKAGATIFTNASKEVTRVEYSKRVTSKTYSKTFSRFLLYSCTIHPTIRTQIEARDRVPSKLFYTIKGMQGENRATWTLISSSFKMGDSSVVSDMYKPAHDPSNPLDVLLKRSLSQGDAPTKKAAIELADKAMTEGNPLEAFLALMEYGLQTGEQLTGHLGKVVQAGKTDRQFRLYGASMGRARSKEQMEKKVELIDMIDRTVLTKGYVLDISKANFVTSLGRMGEARELFLGVLAENPFIAGVYKDMGDLYYRGYNMAPAWRCWNAARRLAPNHSLLKTVTNLEHRLLKKHPEYFLEPVAKATDTFSDL